jgi:hypothetical protein
LRLDSRHEQGTKKTPDEELAEKVHLGTSSFEDPDIYSLRERLRVNDLVWLTPTVNPYPLTQVAGLWR